MQSNEILADLQAWAQGDAKIEPGAFSCSRYNACNASAKGALRRDDTCAMSYIGERYSRQDTIDAEPKLVIPGIDHGEPSGGGTTYQRGREHIKSVYINEGQAFNQHYQGVVKTAAAFLGRGGDHCSVNCKTHCAQSFGAANSACVLEKLVQPNLVKCVPVSAPNMNSVTTRLMRDNCSHHLIAELRILKPDIVVFHGAKARPIVLSSLMNNGVKTTPLVHNHEGNAVLSHVPELKLHMVFLHHPSRYHMDRTWDRDAVPSLEYLRKEGVIPL